MYSCQLSCLSCIQWPPAAAVAGWLCFVANVVSCYCWRYLSTRAFVWWPTETTTLRLGSSHCWSTSMSVRLSWMSARSRNVSSCTSVYSWGTWRTRRGKSTCGYATASRWSPPDWCVPAHCMRLNSSARNTTSSSLPLRPVSHHVLWTCDGAFCVYCDALDCCVLCNHCGRDDKIIIITCRQFLMRHNMIESLQGSGMPGQFELSQRSENVIMILCLLSTIVC